MCSSLGNSLTSAVNNLRQSNNDLSVCFIYEICVSLNVLSRTGVRLYHALDIVCQPTSLTLALNDTEHIFDFSLVFKHSLLKHNGLQSCT